MSKFKLSRSRILVVGAICLTAGYTGVRTAADVSTVFTFRGQRVDAFVVGPDADGNQLISEVTCIDGDDGNNKPTIIKKTWLDDEVDTPDSAHYASTLNYVDYTGSYKGFNSSLNGYASCDAAASGEEALFDFNTWETTDMGPVTIHGTTKIGNAAEVVSGVSTTIVKDRVTGNMSRFRSRGKTGLNPNGTLTVSVTDGGSGTVPAISGDISSDWSDIAIITNSTFSKIHH